MEENTQKKFNRAGTIRNALDENPTLTRAKIDYWIADNQIGFETIPGVKRNKYRVDLDLDEVRVHTSDQNQVLGAVESAGADADSSVPKDKAPVSSGEKVVAGSQLPEQPIGLPNGDHVPGAHWKFKGGDPLKRAKDSLKKSKPEDLLKMKFWIETRLFRGQVTGETPKV